MHLPSYQDNMLVCPCIGSYRQWWANLREVLTAKAGNRHQLAGHRALRLQFTWDILMEFKSFFRSALKRHLCVPQLANIFQSRQSNKISSPYKFVSSFDARLSHFRLIRTFILDDKIRVLDSLVKKASSDASANGPSSFPLKSEKAITFPCCGQRVKITFKPCLQLVVNARSQAEGNCGVVFDGCSATDHFWCDHVRVSTTVAVSSNCVREHTHIQQSPARLIRLSKFLSSTIPGEKFKCPSLPFTPHTLQMWVGKPKKRKLQVLLIISLNLSTAIARKHCKASVNTQN